MDSDELSYWTLYRDCLDIFGHLLIGAATSAILKKIHPHVQGKCDTQSSYKEFEAGVNKGVVGDDSNDSGIDETDRIEEFEFRNGDNADSLKDEITKLRAELANTKAESDQWRRSCDRAQAELADVRNEVCSLKEQNEGLKCEAQKFAKAQEEISVLKEELVDTKDDLDEVKKNCDEWVYSMQEENARLRYDLGRMNHILHGRDNELDDVRGRLMASKYYINYLQNRPEFKNIVEDQILPPDMRKKKSSGKEKKSVRFSETNDTLVFPVDDAAEDVANDSKGTNDDLLAAEDVFHLTPAPQRIKSNTSQQLEVNTYSGNIYTSVHKDQLLQFTVT